MLITQTEDQSTKNPPKRVSSLVWTVEVGRLYARRMKARAFFASLLFLVLLSHTYAQQAAPQPRFVQATRDVRYTNGLITPAGTVELVLDETGTDFVLAGPNGTKLSMAKDAGVLISGEFAAVLLLKERQQLDDKLSELLAERDPKKQPTQPGAPAYLQRRAARQAAAAAALPEFRAQER